MRSTLLVDVGHSSDELLQDLEGLLLTQSVFFQVVPEFSFLTVFEEEEESVLVRAVGAVELHDVRVFEAFKDIDFPLFKPFGGFQGGWSHVFDSYLVFLFGIPPLVNLAEIASSETLEPVVGEARSQFEVLQEIHFHSALCLILSDYKLNLYLNYESSHSPY